MLSKNQSILLVILISLLCFNIALFGVYTYHKLILSNVPLKTPLLPPSTISVNNKIVQQGGNPFEGPALVGKNKNVALYVFNAIIIEIVPGQKKDTLILYAQKPSGELISDALLVRTEVKPILYTGTGKNVPHTEVSITELKKGDQVQLAYNIDLLSHSGEVVGISIYR